MVIYELESNEELGGKDTYPVMITETGLFLLGFFITYGELGLFPGRVKQLHLNSKPRKVS